MNKFYFLYHSDEWWRDTWPLSSVHFCRPERVGCHQPCWLYLYMYECTEWCSNWCTIIMYIPMLTFRITMMLVHKILDCVQVAIGTGQREWSVTSLVDWLCGDHHQQRNSTDKHLLFGSTCLLMRALTISRWPREHSRERGVSPALFTATVDTSKLWTLEKSLAHALVYVSYPRENTPTSFSKNFIDTRRD